MSMVTVDAERCIGCGACVRDCIAGNLSLPRGRAEAAGECFRCGHCVAICPQRAVSIPEYGMEEVEEFSPADFTLDPEQLLRAVKFRRSIREYQPRPVERALLERMIQAGRYTATARNSQGCRFLVVQEELPQFKQMIWNGLGELLEKQEPGCGEAAEAFRKFYENHRRNPAEDYLFRNAPAVVFIAAPNMLDAGLAAQNMELIAVSQGMGVLYNGYLRRAAELVPGVPDWLGAGEKQLQACMLAGYPAVSYRRTAPRREADVCWR